MSKYDFYRDKMLAAADRGSLWEISNASLAALRDMDVNTHEFRQLYDMRGQLVNAIFHGTGPCGGDQA